MISHSTQLINHFDHLSALFVVRKHRLRLINGYVAQIKRELILFDQDRESIAQVIAEIESLLQSERDELTLRPDLKTE